ncbi:MAG: DUF4124 domain-containing protein [Pseudomonadota bacterium]
MRYLLLVSFLLLSLTCVAAIYMQKDAKGNISYSDIPTTDATRVDLPPPTTTSFSTPAAPAAGKAAATSGKAGKVGVTPTETTDARQTYTAFSISSPTEQQTFQNQRDIAVQFNLAPSLQKGDSIQLFVDGSKVGEPAATTQFQVNQLPRGTHQVSANLLDSNKAVLKQAASVTFFVHYAAVGGT